MPPRTTLCRNPRVRVGLATLLAAIFGGAGVAQATTYYVSPSGSDARAGTSPATAWQTLEKVNGAHLSAGDQVLFQGGKSILLSTDSESGPDGNDTENYLLPQSGVTYSTYGSGLATLTPPTTQDSAVFLYGVHDVTLRNLDLEGHGTMSGIVSTEAAGVSSSYITVDNCRVNDWMTGILAAWADSHWLIENSTITRTKRDGIYFARQYNDGTPPTAGTQIDDSVVDSTIQATGLSNDSAGVHGIYDNAQRSTIIGNTITDFSDSAISVRDPNSLVEGNTITAPVEQGAQRGGFGIEFIPYDRGPAGTAIWAYNTITLENRGSGLAPTGLYVSGHDVGGTTRENFLMADNHVTLSDASTADGAAKIAIGNMSGTPTGSFDVAGNVASGASDYELVLYAQQPPAAGSFESGNAWWAGSGGGDWVYHTPSTGSNDRYTSLAAYQSRSRMGTGDQWTTSPTVPTNSFAASSAVRDAPTGRQWIAYVGADGAVWDWYYDGRAWHDQRLGGKATPGTSPVAVRDARSGRIWIYYVGAGRRLMDLYDNGSSWTAGTIGAEPLAPASSPQAVGNATTGRQWVFFQGADGAIWDADSGDGRTWQVQRRGGAAALGSGLAAVSDDRSGTVWVFYVNSSRTLSDFSGNGTTWTSQALGSQAVALASGPAAVRNATTRAQWVAYVSAGGGLRYASSSDGHAWHDAALGGQAAPASSPVAMQDPGSGAVTIAYSALAGSLAGWVSSGSSWRSEAIPGARPAAGDSPSAVHGAPSGCQWIYEVGVDGALWQAALSGGSWSAHQL